MEEISFVTSCTKKKEIAISWQIRRRRKGSGLALCEVHYWVTLKDLAWKTPVFCFSLKPYSWCSIY